MKEELKKVIQEAVPEIMELKFGCVVYFMGMPTTYLNSLYVWAAKRPIEVCAEEEDIEILGRPIRLADVLLAMQDIWRTRYNSSEVSDKWKELAKAKEGELLYAIVFQWNLKDDNLDHQSEETIEFLHKLLVK